MMRLSPGRGRVAPADPSAAAPGAASGPPAVVAFEDVTLTVGSRRVLSAVSFAIAQGRFVGVLGPNGAGKTSLLRAVLGMIPARAGRISVLGRPATRGNAAVGYVPQFRRGAADLRLSGFDLVLGAVAGLRWGWPLATRADRATATRALDRVGALALARRPLAELSGGERQRILVAQALIGDPQLLLLDEPLASLDPAHQRQVVETVQAVSREAGIAVLFCAHEVNPILKAVDAVLYLGGGRAAMGPVDEVITGPVLSALYRTPIHVARDKGRIYVLAEDAELERVREDDPLPRSLLT